jgi:hypothetical protein
MWGRINSRSNEHRLDRRLGMMITPNWIIQWHTSIEGVPHMPEFGSEVK